MLCSFATSIPMLAAFRAVQGLGAGGLFSLALAIIGDIVPPRERAKYQGYFLAVFGTSSVLGPVIGGFFAGQDTLLGIAGWRWVFLVNVPIGIAALVVVTRTLHLRHTRLDHRIDWWGAAALTVGLVPLLLVAEQGRVWGWGSGRSITCYVIGGIGVVAFFLAERMMGDEALLPLQLFQNRTVGISSIASVILGMGMFGGIACLPLYLQIVKGASPTEAGLLLLPMTLGIMTGSIVSGQMISRTGRYRHFPIIGSALLVLSLFGFHYVGADTPLWKTMIVMFFFGVGLGFNLQPLTLAVQNAVAARHRRGHLVGDLHPPDRRHARHRGLPVDPLLGRAGPAPDGLPHDRPELRLPGGAEAPTGRRRGQPGLHLGAAVGAQSGGSGGAFDSALNDSSFIQQIDPRLAQPFLVGFSEAIDLVFLIGSGVMVVAFVVLWFLPNVELRSGSSYAERGRADSGRRRLGGCSPGGRALTSRRGSGRAASYERGLRDGRHRKRAAGPRPRRPFSCRGAAAARRCRRRPCRRRRRRRRPSPRGTAARPRARPR